MIIFLPPIEVNKIYDEGSVDHKRCSLNSYTPKVVINRVFKSKDLLIYQIESLIDTITRASDTTQSITSVSSQPGPSAIKTLYKELKFEIISDLIENECNILPTQLINIFGIVLNLDYSKKDETFKCTTVSIFDFNINKPVYLKMWRGLAAWISSLAVGSRIQARNLILKNSQLHSTSSTEIYLLAASDKCTKLSSRIDYLNEKEKDILTFLNNQSLLVPKCLSSSSALSCLLLSFPFYLQFNGNSNCPFWIFQGFGQEGSKMKTIRFNHFDANIWQSFTEIFLESSALEGEGVKFEFKDLNQIDSDNFDFNSTSNLKIINSSTEHVTSSYSSHCYKVLDWKDLISAKVVLFGTFELEGILIFNADNNTLTEESLENLSMLPDEQLRSAQLTSTQLTSTQSLMLSCPHNPNWVTHVDQAPANTYSSCSSSPHKFIVNIKTILNEGNVHEIVRKSVKIL